ncbi:MAG TPA: hypothetical protein VLE74_04080 [Candidatus Saccharimonadales bacterium]|nr:hypothetical protein [Candidatus Saccharimonadales bacterium]
MTRYKILRHVTRVADLALDDFYDKGGDVYDWQLKARRIQARRWRKLKQQLV